MKKLLVFLILAGLFVSCKNERADANRDAYDHEQDSLEQVIKKKKLAEHAAEDSLFAPDTRPFDPQKAVYTQPQKLNYKEMYGRADDLAEEKDIFPIGFSNDWKFYAYIAIDPYTHDGTTTYEAMLYVVALDTFETGSYKRIEASGKHDIGALWSVNKDSITAELKKFHIIQKGLSEYKAGSRFATKRGTIELKVSETKAQLMQNGKAITDLHGYSVEVHAKNEDTGRKMTVDSLPTMTLDIKSVDFLGGFTGKRYLYCLLVMAFEGTGDKPFVLFRQIGVPLNPSKYK